MLPSSLRVVRSLLLVATMFGSAAVSAQNAITQPADPVFPSSANTPVGAEAGSAIDNNQATKFLNFDSGRDGNQIGTFSPSGFVVVPAAGASRVTAILMQSANDAPDRDPDSILLEGSNDTNITSYASGTWAQIAIITNIAAGFTSRFQEQTFSFRNNRVFKAYRWTVQSTRLTPNGCCVQVAEVELLGTLGEQNVNHAYDISRPDDIILPSSDNSPPVERFWNAIDNTAETKYLNFDSGRDGNQIGTFSPSGFVVTPVLTRTVVTGMTIQSANDEPSRDPDVVVLFGSNDTNITTYASGTWEQITTLSNIAAGFVGRFQEQTFFFTNNTKPFRSYKWEVQRVRTTPNGCCMQVGEVQLLGNVATELELPVIGASSISLTAAGSSGDLLFLNRNYQVPVPRVDNAIRLDTVGSNGLAHFTLDRAAGNAFFQTRRVPYPTVLGDGSHAIKILTFVRDTIATNTGTAAFAVVAEGTTTNLLQYQWYKNGAPITGAVGPSLFLTNVTFADEGNYSCDVNMVGHPAVRVATSGFASSGGRLTVAPNLPPTPPPVTLGDGTNAVSILAFPRDIVVLNTGVAQFSISAQSGTNALQYQWFWNEIPLTNNFRISGANGSTLTISNAHFDPNPPSPPAISTNTDVGFYSCEINIVGHPAAGRARSADTNSPGARLFVYTESPPPPPTPGKIRPSFSSVVTAIYGPSQPGGTTTGCDISGFTSWVVFQNPGFNPPTTWFQRRLGTWCTATDESNLYTYGLRVLVHDNGGGFCMAAPNSSTSSSARSSVTFPTRAYPTLYEFALYVTRGTLPPGTQLNLRITWF